jgi:phage shock protein E
MGVKRNTVIGILTIATFIGCGLAANAQEHIRKRLLHRL